jgi:hypothetical protein
MDNLLHSITARVAAFGCFLLVSACDGLENFSWENHPTLSWDDFRGTGFKPGFAAETYSGLTRALICKGGTLDVSVAAEFWPFTSWVRPDRKGDLLLLKHEQGHFDITNVMARNARESIKLKAAGLTVKETGCGDAAARDAARGTYDTNVSSVLRQLGNDWMATKDRAQQDYDGQTVNSSNAAKQRAWETDIAAGLRAYVPANAPVPAAAPAQPPGSRPAAPTPANPPANPPPAVAPKRPGEPR